MALVNVDTVVVCTQLKTSMTVALIGTNHINASAVVADVRMADALVDIQAVVSGRRKHVTYQQGLGQTRFLKIFGKIYLDDRYTENFPAGSYIPRCYKQ